MTRSKQAARSAFIIIIFTIASKLLGFLRESLIAAKFGSGTLTDMFFIALTAISLFTTIITNSINTTMIPVLSKIDSKEGKRGKIGHTNNILNIVFFISLLIMSLAWLLSPIILKVLAYGFHDEQFKYTLLMMRMGLPAIIFAGIQGVFRGYLQSELMFAESAATLFPFNFVYIFFLICLSSNFGIKGLMITSIFAVAAQVIIQLPGIRKAGFKYRFVFDFKDKYFKEMALLIPPVLISVAINDLNKIIDKSMASTLIEGSISSLNYADRVNGIITSVFISAIITVIFPLLSKEVNRDTYDGLKKVVIHGINTVLLITIPATIGIIILANPIVKVAFQRGAFDSTAAYMTVGALVFYSVGLVASALLTLLNTIYYSFQDTKTPMIFSIVAVLLNVIFNFALIKFMEHKGLALATSISSIITMMFLLYTLKKKIGSFGILGSIKCGIKSFFATTVMGIVVYFLNMGLTRIMVSNTLSELIALLASVSVGVLVYLVIIYIFKIEEMEWIIKVVKEKIGKK